MSVTTIRHEVIEGGFKVVTTAFDGQQFYAMFQVYKQYDGGIVTLLNSVWCQTEQSAIKLFDSYL